MAGFSIVLPWPASTLNGQSGVSKWAKIKSVKKHRNAAWLICLNAKNRGLAEPILEGRVGWRAVFYAPARIRVDEANLLTACKPYIDGVVDAGLLAGDHASVLTLLGADGSHRDPKNPRVELFFEKL